jgi:hypothetical protein
MKRIISLALLVLATCSQLAAQKTVYIPNEWRNPWNPDTLLYKESDPDGKYTWSKTRSVESDNVIIFWDKYYKVAPDKLSANDWNYVDIPDLLKKCEAFFDLEINKLGFVDATKSNLSKYKVMVLMNYSKPGDWACYGGGYDFVVSALWLNAATCKPVGHSVAHEVGHSFHYMCYGEHSGHKDSSTDNTGFHLQCGNGQTIWEQTAQWQANQSYPELMYDQSISVFRKSHNYAFSHEWHRYQSYWFHYYLCQHYNDITTVAQVWNQPMTGQKQGNGTDFNQALMALKGLDATGLFRLYYDYAARCATWDLDACKPYRDPYIGDFDYRCVQTADKTYQVALASTPQSTGFNVIPLKVPEAGTRITTHFSALRAASKLAEGDPSEMMNGETSWAATGRTTYIRPTSPSQRAFRLGYVALMADGSRQYFNEDSLYCQGTSEVTEDVVMTVPAGVSRLWLIVSPAPKKYTEHRWLEKSDNAEHWPYRFELDGTDIGDRATVYVPSVIDGREVADITLTYQVNLPQLNSYASVPVSVSGNALAQLGTAFQLQTSELASKLVGYSAAGPKAGKMMFYPLHPKDLTLVNNGSTANGYGHWFNASGAVSDWNGGFLYSELDASSMTFNIGQYPNKVKKGEDYTIGQAFRYKASTGKEAVARFIFHIHITGSEYGAELSNIDYTTPTGIDGTVQQSEIPSRVYDLQGRPVNTVTRHGIYIKNGKKIVL